jgi:hypothetical protein
VRGIDRKYDAYIEGNYINTREEQMKNVPIDERRWVTNRYEINQYLGRVNVVSLFPTLVMLSGLISGSVQLARGLATTHNSNGPQISLHLFTLVVVVSLAGYLWFLVLYTRNVPATVKATYMLQIFPFLALLTGELLMKMKGSSKGLLNAVLVGVVIVFLHNLPTLFTSYNNYLLSNMPRGSFP